MSEYTASERFRAYRVEPGEQGVAATVKRLSVADLPEGEVTVRVAWSSLNYKDALSARGRPGVTRHYPHTPGIDAAGTVLHSTDQRFSVGDRVIVTSYDLGVNTAGGFGERIRVPGDWVVPLPANLTLREAMVLGTAGLTAGLALDALECQGVNPEAGPVVVSGASGGVGSLAVAILSARGYEVTAATGTSEAVDWLKDLGAARIVDRSEFGEPSERPLLKALYAGAVDTVGGHTLASLLKSVRHGGAVAACGMVQSPDLPINVFPFILRGVSLLGIDSAACPMPRRTAVWERLAGEWKPSDLDGFAHEVGLEELDDAVDRILAGRTIGRIVVRVSGE